jgi:hypothetical protein
MQNPINTNDVPLPRGALQCSPNTSPHSITNSPLPRTQGPNKANFVQPECSFPNAESMMKLCRPRLIAQNSMTSWNISQSILDEYEGGPWDFGILCKVRPNTFRLLKRSKVEVGARKNGGCNSMASKKKANNRSNPYRKTKMMGRKDPQHGFGSGELKEESVCQKPPPPVLTCVPSRPSSTKPSGPAE